MSLMFVINTIKTFISMFIELRKSKIVINSYLKGQIQLKASH